MREMLTDLKGFAYEERYLKGASFHVYAAIIYTPDYQKDETGNSTLIYAKDAL